MEILEIEFWNILKEYNKSVSLCKLSNITIAISVYPKYI